MAIYKSNYQTYILQNGHFSQISNFVWELKDIDVYAKVVWAYLVSQRSSWDSSRNNLARNLDITPRKITNSVNELKKFNMLKVITDGNSKKWNFEIIAPDYWLLQLPSFGASGAPKVVPASTHTQYTINSNTSGSSSPLKKISRPGPHTSVVPSSTLARYLAQGKTPADFGGMSVEEAAAQRDYSNHFPELDTKQAVREWREAQEKKKNESSELHLDIILETLPYKGEDD